MIILPDKNICATKFLMPVPKNQWMPSSQAIPKDQFGNDCVRTRFRVRAKLNDGFVKWIGWFDDRDDMDAFLWAIAKGTLKYEKHLWDLCLPNWNPDIGEELSYDFYTVINLTGPTPGSNQTYTRPVDWNATNNVVWTIGGGGGGRRQATSGVAGAGGAGGGACSGRANINIAATATYQIGTAGVGGTAQSTSGTAGGDTWFNGTSLADSGVSSKGVGAKGGSGSTGSTGAAGGVAASGFGTSLFSGGTGGNGQGTNGAGGGGGGAAGQNAAGGNGTNGASGNGGNGGAGNGGIGGGGAGATPDLSLIHI